MASSIVTSLNIPFDLAGAGSDQVIIEDHGTISGGRSLLLSETIGVTGNVFGQVRFYPADNDLKVATSYDGILQKAAGFERSNVILEEPVTLSGASSVSTAYPVFSLQGVNQQGTGAFFDKEGNEVTPIFSYNSDTKQIDINIEVYGFVLVSYTSKYHLYDYIPKVLTNGRGGSYQELDILYGFLNGNVSSFKINPVEFERNYQEVITMYSEIVIRKDGAHEKPANYPTDGIYPPPFDAPAGDLPTTGYYIQKRVHIVYYTDLGRLHERRLHQEINPPDGNSFMVGGHAVGNLFYPLMSLSVSYPSDASNRIIQSINSKIVDLQNDHGAVIG